jgi:hypothetical protein
VRLTSTQVSLIAAAIALVAPAITYRASARLDRWVREGVPRPTSTPWPSSAGWPPS